jgi:hypothetical protein
LIVYDGIGSSGMITMFLKKKNDHWKVKYKSI